MNAPRFPHIIACLDMYGCPNRCLHCWLGVTPNGHLSAEDLRFVAACFRPFTDALEVVDRYREEDYGEDYKELWALTTALSDVKTPHFENISYWRAVRDETYVPWLYALGVRAAQLTLFGDEAHTDMFVGRKGAYREILQTVELLIQNGIAPRFQMFVYKRNLSQLPFLRDLIAELQLEARCATLERPFSFFLHQGTCDGENEKLYAEWITEADLALLPEPLVAHTLRHFGRTHIREVLGDTEAHWCEVLADADGTENIVSDTPVFLIDRHLDVYPNYETPSPWWCLGNLRTDDTARILERYRNNGTVGQRTRMTVPARTLVARYGDPGSTRLFGRKDYLLYLHGRHCRDLDGMVGPEVRTHREGGCTCGS